jgi:membrane associated rhomboid family serine protease
MLFGVLPGNPGISWQAHLFGALFGILAAWLVARRANRAQVPPPITAGTP